MTVLELPAGLVDRLDRLAEQLQQSPQDLAAAVLEGFLDHEEREGKKLDEALADADAGRVIEHARVAAWLRSWGTADVSLPRLAGQPAKVGGHATLAICW